jgi:hypothetical protein
MDYFKYGKYQTIDENIPYVAMKLYSILDKKMTLDELIEQYSKENKVTISMNLERVFLLSITFLFSIEKIKFFKGKLERC